MLEFTANYNLVKGATGEPKQELVIDQKSTQKSHHCPNTVQDEMPV